MVQQAMVRGDLDILQDWCYEAVSCTRFYNKFQNLICSSVDLTCELFFVVFLM